jgi:hypothetical protein
MFQQNRDAPDTDFAGYLINPKAGYRMPGEAGNHISVRISTQYYNG